MLRSKRGKIIISNDIYTDVEMLEYLSKAFRDLEFVPLRTEFLYEKNCFEIIGISYCFDELEQGDIVPEYELEIQTKGSRYLNNREYDFCTIKRLEQ